MAPRALKLAIVGRPNVGKSTLFNRLAGRKLAIVDDQPGVTRDRKFATGRIGDLDLEIVDTAGFEDVSDESLEARMRQRASYESDVLQAGQPDIGDKLAAAAQEAIVFLAQQACADSLTGLDRM